MLEPIYGGLGMTGPGVSIVTGGGRGIGRAVALALAGAGHPVCVNDTGVGVDGRGGDADVAEAVAEEIRAAGGRALAVPVDARTRAGAETVVAAVEAWAGESPVVLVHAAGTLRDAMVHKASDDDWAEVLGVHLHVAVELTRAVVPASAGTATGASSTSAARPDWWAASGRPRTPWPRPACSA